MNIQHSHHAPHPVHGQILQQSPHAAPWMEQQFMPPALAYQSPAAYAAQSQPNSRLSPEAVTYLKSIYSVDPKPTTAYKRSIAANLNVDIAKINNWFQNERAKTKSAARVEQQRRVNGELPAESDETPSSSSSASGTPPMEQGTNAASSSSAEQLADAPFVRTPAPLQLALPFSSPPAAATTNLAALNLEATANFSQSHLGVHLQQHQQHGPIPLSAPAHMTTFPHHDFLQPWMTQLDSTHAMHAPLQGMDPHLSAFPGSQPPTIVTPIPAGELDWDPFTPISASFDMGASLIHPSAFETPLASAQLEGCFDFSPAQPSPGDALFSDMAWPTSGVPQLSPTGEQQEQSVVSESHPHTPATSYAAEQFSVADASQFHDQFPLITSGALVAGDLSPVKTVDPADLLHPHGQQSSQQPAASSFTRKRNIDIPQLSLHHSNASLQSVDASLQSANASLQSLPLSRPKLRNAKSMSNVRSGQRSPLHPMRDDTRRISKAASHARLPQTSIPPVPALPKPVN